MNSLVKALRVFVLIFWSGKCGWHGGQTRWPSSAFSSQSFCEPKLFQAEWRFPRLAHTNIHHFWAKQEYFWVARVSELVRKYFWNASKLVRCKMSWMITNRHQKKQPNISCIPDGNVHAFHHKIFYLALKEFKRESFFLGKMCFLLA